MDKDLSAVRAENVSGICTTTYFKKSRMKLWLVPQGERGVIRIRQAKCSSKGANLVLPEPEEGQYGYNNNDQADNIDDDASGAFA